MASYRHVGEDSRAVKPCLGGSPSRRLYLRVDGGDVGDDEGI